MTRSQLLVVALLLTACGKDDKPKPADPPKPPEQPARWDVGGVMVPVTAIPKTLQMPTLMPVAVGAPLTEAAWDENRFVPGQLSMSYLVAEGPSYGLVSGYNIMSHVDLLAPLHAAWGPSTTKPNANSDEILHECWDSAAARLEACLHKNRDQPIWNLDFVGTSPLPTAKVEKPATTGTFTDAPPGAGPCAVIGVKEASEIVSTQLSYAAGTSDAECSLTSSNVQVVVTLVKNLAVIKWDPSITDMGDKAGWFADTLYVGIKDTAYRIEVHAPASTLATLRDQAMQVGRKVAARASTK